MNSAAIASTSPNCPRTSLLLAACRSVMWLDWINQSCYQTNSRLETRRHCLRLVLYLFSTFYWYLSMAFSFTRTHALYRFLPFHLPLCWTIYFYLHQSPHFSLHIFQHSLVHIYRFLCHYFFCLSLLVKNFLFVSLSKHLFLPKWVGNFLLDFLRLFLYLYLRYSPSFYIFQQLLHTFLALSVLRFSLFVHNFIFLSLSKRIYFQHFLIQSIHFCPPFLFVGNTLFFTTPFSLSHFVFSSNHWSMLFFICFVC